MISRLEGANPVVNSAQEGVESVSILAVIVLYRLPPSESPALLSLRASATALNHGNVRLKILLYDNTPAGQRSATIPEDIEYWPAGTNQGISAAYNFALKMAGDQRFDWLLTLDQDTTVPASFLECISALARNLAGCVEVAGLVPEAVDHGTFISPHVLVCGCSRRLPKGFTGISNGSISAINSGAIWRTSSLREIGGFHSLFWLDYLDHWLFHAIQLSGKRIYVIGNLEIEHELSLLNPRHQLSAERLTDILRAESAFHDLYHGPISGCLLTMKTFVRLSFQVLRGKRRELWPVTWNSFVERIVCRKATRIIKWEQDMRCRLKNTS